MSRGRGTKSKQIFPSPAAQRFLINGRMHRVFARQGTLVPATPGWERCGLRATHPGLTPSAALECDPGPAGAIVFALTIRCCFAPLHSICKLPKSDRPNPDKPTIERPVWCQQRHSTRDHGSCSPTEHGVIKSAHNGVPEYHCGSGIFVLVGNGATECPWLSVFLRFRPWSCLTKRT